jgi:dihydroorotase
MSPDTIKYRKQLITAAKKIASDKKLILLYLEGKATKQDLEKHGVKLAMPL